ncbi:MAG: DUF4157 domain-containing protein [Myxococcota bacterium]
MTLKMNAVSSMGGRRYPQVPPILSRGQPLPPSLRQCAERVLGEDLSSVRVFVSNAAPRIGAVAFTMGSQIHVAPGAYDPDSAEGVELLGHELAHVVQQRRGRVRNPRGYGIAVVEDAALEREADEVGVRLRKACLQAKVRGSSCACGSGDVRSKRGSGARVLGGCRCEH